MNAWTRCWLCLAWLAVAAPALAQSLPNDSDRREYRAFDIDKDAADIIKKRLQIEKDLGPLKELVKQVLADPKNRNPDLVKQLQGMKLDEKLKQAFQEMLGNDPALKNDLREWIKKTNDGKQPPETAQSLKDLDQILADSKKPTTIPGLVKQTPDITRDKDIKPDETTSKSLENAMKNFETSQLGDWLRGSPAWQQAIRDLRTSMDNPQASKWKLGDWSGKLLTRDGKAWKLGEATLERLKNMPRPDLEHWNLKLSLPGLGNIPTPSLGPPALPRFSAPSLSTGATWLLLAVLCLLVGWQLMRWSKRSAVEFDPRVSLGPWPVKPNEVATRSDLVKAFDYLAILTLGLDAKCWNHQAIARRWCANAPHYAPMAAALAGLYEQARYTDGPSELTHPQRDWARQALLQIAEVR
jgi:hypothetical protein